MGFRVNSSGIYGQSLGRIQLAFWWDRVPLLYISDIHWMGHSIATNCVSSSPFQITNDLTGRDDESLLLRMGGHMVEFKLENVGFGNGPVRMTFNIFNQNQPNPVYQVVRRPSVRGINSGNVETTVLFHSVRIDLNHHQSTGSVIFRTAITPLAAMIPFGAGRHLHRDPQQQSNDAFSTIMAGVPLT